MSSVYLGGATVSQRSIATVHLLVSLSGIVYWKIQRRLGLGFLDYFLCESFFVQGVTSALDGGLSHSRSKEKSIHRCAFNCVGMAPTVYTSIIYIPNIHSHTSVKFFT